MPAVELVRLLPPILLLPAKLLLLTPLLLLLLLTAPRLRWLHLPFCSLSQKAVAGRMRLSSPSTDSITAGALDHHMPQIFVGP
mgnify:CR=1 FL=1